MITLRVLYKRKMGSRDDTGTVLIPNKLVWSWFICTASVSQLSILLINNLLSIQGSDVSCRTMEGRELFNKFVDHCEVTEVDKRLIKDAISVFAFLVGSIVEEFER